MNGPFVLLGTSAGITYTDSTVSVNNAYLYRVRAIASDGSFSVPSNMALGTAFSFEFSALQGQAVKAQHIYDLRTTINAVRAAANLPGVSWTITNLSNALVQASVVQELRNKLDEALQALSINAGAYTDPTLSTGTNGTLVKAIHLEQLQTRSTRGSSSSAGPLDSDSSTARLDPLNETGGGGENPLSRNFNWNLPLLKLTGRGGLDLSLTLSYNSLIWAKSGNSTISFDDDHGFPGPGFRLGFPTIQLPYFDSQTSTNAFLLIAPDGSHIELRQVSTNSVYYESADSHHLLLDTTLLSDPNDPRMVLRRTDGSQLTYRFKSYAYECTEVKDKNGNFITVNYNTSGVAAGRIANIHDTLDRLITFNYDGTGLLTSITQQWKRQPPNQTQVITHTWASFAYTDLTLQPNFATGMSVLGPPNNSTKVLTSVTLDDNSTTPANNSHSDFEYTPFAQVWKISRKAADNHLLNYRAYKLPQSPIWTDPPVAQTECPRFTERRDWGQWANGDTDGTPASAEESVTTFSASTAANWVMPDGVQHAGQMVRVTQPDGTSDKIYFADTVANVAKGWLRGLQEVVETYDVNGTVPQRQSFTNWEQDNETVSYELNPRVKETNVSDPSGNRKRTTITYQSFTPPSGSAYKLKRDVLEYAADTSTVLRSTRTDYVDGDNTINTPYLSRRLFGLAKETTLYEGNVTNGGTLASRVGFSYDETGSIQGSDTPVQHDPVYGSSFVSGRGNVSTVKRYDVNNGQFTASAMKYNTAGAVVSTKDALQHETKIDYSDSYSFSVSQTTLAYPTKVTDPDGYYSTSQYNFDFGAATSRKTPPPNFTDDPNVTPQPAGPEQQLLYDDLGRLERTTNLVNNAYTRFVYVSNGFKTEIYATLVAGQGEARSFKISDGFGRVIATASDHPATSGTVARYDAQRMEYDVMGRLIKTSNPAETSAIGDDPSQWQLVEGDVGSSWVYTQQTYDWKGRPKVTTNQDGTTKTADYTGCGCAGGEVVTVTDEGTIGGGGTKRRQQRTYSDVLGRIAKTEILNWDGTGPDGTGPNNTVYSATVNTYNVRDQVTQVREYAGPEGSGTYQDTTMTYDGYGRLQLKHLPEQNAGTNTSWTYNSDDTVNTNTDARGAVCTYGYAGNQRGLVKTITHTLSGSPTINVSYTYDAAGNRTRMTDSTGSVDYTFDQLSRLSVETRTFSGVGTYSINSAYSLDSQLTSITDPFGASFTYQRDSVGRLKTVTGSPYAGVTNYVTDVNYRAWGAPKSVSYDGTSSTIAYNGRMQPNQFRLTSNATGAGIIREDYAYYGDGRLATLTDLDDTAGNNPPATLRFLSRVYSYDHVGRVTAGSGNPGGGAGMGVPYNQSYSYDEFGNMKGRSGIYYSYNNNPFLSDTTTFTNNRRNGWSYNPDGKVTAAPSSSTDNARSMSYDAAGRMITTFESGTNITYAAAYDGDGHLLKEINTTPTTSEASYIVRSTALGGEVLTRLDQSGNKKITHVPAEGLLFATQRTDPSSGPFVINTQRNPLGTTETNKAVYDPLGNYIPFQAWSDPRPPLGSYSSASMGGLSASLANPYGYGLACRVDGIPTYCSQAMRWLNSGIAAQCPENNCGPYFDPNRDGKGRGGWLVPVYNDDGLSLQKIGPSQKPKDKPQKPTTVWEPLGGVDKARELLVKTLGYGDCKKAIQQLFSKIAEDTGFPASHTDALDLFDSMRAQTGGGGILVDLLPSQLNDHLPAAGRVDQQPAGGGGLSSYFYASGHRERWSAVWIRGAYSDSPKLAFDRIPFAYALTLIHELAHNAPSDDSRLGRVYEHSEMDAAAKELGSTNFDQYVREHCIPKEYW